MKKSFKQQPVHQRLVKKLVTQADAILPGPYAGMSWRELQRFGAYEEAGFKLTKEDMLLTQHYAGLAVLCKLLHDYLASHPRTDGEWFEKIINEMSAEEKNAWYGPTAFPYDSENFPFLAELEKFPKGLVENAERGTPSVKELANPAFRHEWTVKPGKKLLLKFAEKFKDVICGKDGPFEQFENGLVGQAALPTTIATQILAVGLSTATLWYPLAVYIALLLVKTGLKTYCEPDLPRKKRSLSKTTGAAPSR